MPNQTPSGVLSAIENSVRRHPGDASAQEIMQGLGAEIPLRTLQYRLKSLVERNRLVVVGKGRWAKYRLRDGTADSSPDMQPGLAAAPHNHQTKSASALAQDLGMLSGKLKRRLREQAHPEDLTISQISVLVRLEQDGPATVSSLARSEGMRPQSLGTVIAAMEAANLVIGTPDPRDRRQTLLSLTDTCRRLVQEARAAREDWLTRTIQARLSPQEQNILATAIELLKRIVDG